MTRWSRLTKEGRYQPPAFVRVLHSLGEWHGPNLQQCGDGSWIPNEYLELAVEIIKEARALVTWTPGHVLLIDLRAPLQGNSHRKLLASLWDEPLPSYSRL